MKGIQNDQKIDSSLKEMGNNIKAPLYLKNINSSNKFSFSLDERNNSLDISKITFNSEDFTIG